MDKIPPPGVYIKEEMVSRGWTQEDLAKVLKRPLPTINRILNGKHAILPEMALDLAEAFGVPAEIWMSRESAYRLSLVQSKNDDIRQRASLYALAPVKEMQKRGWIQPAEDAGSLEVELKQFFGVDDLDEESLQMSAAMRRTEFDSPLSPAQRAWCYRVRQIARSVLVAEFKPERLPLCRKDLRKIAAYPQETYKVPAVLSNYGIRLVIVEPLTGTKVDGVATWLDPTSPVIGMSLRYERNDSFWHTLCHEISHIAHKDEAPLDSDLTDKMENIIVVKSEMERRADKEASDTLISADDLQSFILRVGPLYSKERIIQFAHSIKMHPGIIVGQLQHRHEIGFHANREMLSKVRNIVTAAAVTDGWGNTIDMRSLE
jgi:HTH-type transcriptional regulator/antitoxin HigA